MVNSTFKAVIFDLDGVLTDTAHYHYLAWKQLAASEGITLDPTFNEQLKGVDRMASLDLILALSPRSYTDEQKQTMAETKNRHYLELIKNMTPSDLMPGALTSLQLLQSAGILIGLASASRNALSVISSLEIRQYFDVVVDAAKIKNGKPDAEIFLTAAQQLGVQPTECLGVEDSLAGVCSIKAAGMRCLGIGLATILTQADWVIPNLASFKLDEY